jgi:hypothetical protein
MTGRADRWRPSAALDVQDLLPPGPLAFHQTHLPIAATVQGSAGGATVPRGEGLGEVYGKQGNLSAPVVVRASDAWPIWWTLWD